MRSSCGPTNSPNGHKFVADNAAKDATIYADDAAAYRDLPFNHEIVKHGIRQYVDGKVHTNSIESFWAMLKWAHKSTFHKISPKHLQRYVDEFVGRPIFASRDMSKQDDISTDQP